MEIKAFKAYRFNPEIVGTAGDCIAPPYDVIKEQLQEALYKQNDYNIVRIIKGKQSEQDSENDNVYTRARDYLNSWIEENALRQDEKPSIYAYVQKFEAAGENFARSGFIALGRLAAFGKGVQPHEKTLDGPKADRLNLTRACKAQFGQIFMLYNDPEKVVEEIIDKCVQGEPLIEFCDEEGVQHSLYSVDADQDIAAVASMMQDKDPVIADGHHRYETALNYYNESGDPNAQYRMMTFVNMYNEGLVVLPTHRLAGDIEGFDIGKLITDLREQFEIEEFGFSDDSEKQDAKARMFEALERDFQSGKNSFGIYAADKAFYKIMLKDISFMASCAPELSEASRRLDVTILHRLILENILGIGDAQLASQANLEYIKGIGSAADDSISRVDSGEKQVVFFMNPTPVKQVRDVADAGEKMPQKSTFFYPKIYTGLTINKI
ncbi:hypothetical protein L21SP3_00490 [Sedimentisphaera cyanobacteriorum]|uniref:DUF1015 domain-containing protein n=1 Tax=Sedimentisphaera cyanobacteriorum TaxID=1940790 RepID=A0A1Q2HN34_9BACT|nr:DUF1015 domain-containing protein [Sedimentisphaera cyanobacteriorum]AQQ08701.1 hypothetical protein L21SP3_00490 [Sedimentisphaera cyanobacteriorum]